MTATPIPRTIALTAYSDLDLSIIDQMPKDRKPIKTWVVPTTKRKQAYAWIKSQIKTHQTQAFVVCPLIKDSDSTSLEQVKAVQTEYTNLTKNIFPKLALDLLHGRLKAKDKQKVLNKFKKNKTSLLVSTPVIEVGIDFPNASIMVIEAAERFGLAQLHQLRGRVGRGKTQGYCLLFTSSGNANTTRLKALETINSGFKLAELDLKLRGQGDIYGTHQHGFNNLKLADFSNTKLIKKTNIIAKKMLKTDPSLNSYPKLISKLQKIITLDHIKPN